MKKIIGFGLAFMALAAFSFLGLSSCNVAESKDSYVLRLQLNDSLTVERQLFKIIDIDLFDSSGVMTHEDVFHGAYSRNDAEKLANLVVTTKIPNPVTIRITAYKEINDYYIFNVTISNGKRVDANLTPTHISPTTPVIPTAEDSLAPKSLAITSPATPVLYLDDPSLSLSARAEPAGTIQTVTWTVAFGDAAIVEAGDKLKPLKAGTVTLKATSTRAPSVFATMELTIKEAATELPKSVKIGNTSPLLLTAGGPSIALVASVLPSTAKQAITWTLPPNTVAMLEPGNLIKGLNPGTVTLTASSTILLSIFNTLVVTVQGPSAVLPESLSLRMATPMILAVDKEDGEIFWTVGPTGADPAVEWSSSDSTIAQIVGGNKVRPLKKGGAKITGKSKTKPTVTTSFDVSIIVPVKVDAISMLPKNLTLYTGGPDGKVVVTLTGSDTGAQYTLSSSNVDIASVSAAGSVKGLTSGTAIISAAVVGSSTMTSVCSVLVIKDSPVVTVSPNQSVAFNGEAVFTVSVALQAYGTTVEIKADMDGDNVYEQTVLNKETADFKQKYTEAKTTTVSFKVKDTEGNEETVTRKVTVGAPGLPMISILNPSKDTTIRTDSLKIRFSVKDVSQNLDATIDSTVKFLVEGKNTIRVSRKNAGGEGSDLMEVTVDRIGPAKPVFTAWAAGQNPTTDSRPIWKWTANPDAAKFQVKMDISDTSSGMIDVISATQYQPNTNLPDGPHTLYLRAIDAAGNVSAVANLAVTVKASPPAKPVAVATPISPATLRSPVWKWQSGDVTKGNGKFRIWLNDVEQPIASVASYTGATLPDGTYILKVKELDDLSAESAELVFASIIVDGTKPVITVSGRASGDLVSLTTTRATTVTGSIVEMGGSGLTSATWELSGGTTKAATAIGTPGSFTINTGNMTNGTSTTLTLRATDGAKSAVAFTIIFTVNIPKPTMAFVSPTPADGYVSNGPITAYYQVDNGLTQDTVLNVAAPTSGETSTLIPLSITALNEGGTTTITRTFYRTHAGVRFFTASGTAGADCNSWQKACKFEGNLSGNTGKYFWLQSGQYDISGNPFNISGIQLFGGIKSNGKNILDRSGETAIFSTNANTGRSYLGNGAVLTKVTISGDFYEKVFSVDPGSLIRFVECKFAALTAYGASASYGTLMGGSEVNLRFERCTLDNSAGNGAWLVGGKSSPYYNLYQDCTFIPSSPSSSFSNDIENGSGDPGWIIHRFVNPTGAPRMMLEDACGLPGSQACQ